jgi:hypothetical protein
MVDDAQIDLAEQPRFLELGRNQLAVNGVA